jgi:hypothetical protein
MTTPDGEVVPTVIALDSPKYTRDPSFPVVSSDEVATYGDYDEHPRTTQ